MLSAGGTFASTGDFSTATKLFRREAGEGSRIHSGPASSALAAPERDTLTLTPAESMSLEDLGNIETYSRQRRDRGSFSPTSGPARQQHQQQQRRGGSMELTGTGEFQSALSMGGRPGMAGMRQDSGAELDATGVYKSAASLLGRNIENSSTTYEGGASEAGGRQIPPSSLYSENADTGEFQSATSLFSQNAQIVSSRTSSEETKARGGTLPPKTKNESGRGGQRRRSIA
jgi:hypothetical protein